MEKYHGFDKQFYDNLFDKIITDGGLRLQIIAADLVNELQKKYDATHNLNLFRKQYGNIYQALKAMKSKPFFDLDNSVIRMKSPQIVRTLDIRKDLMQKYEQKLKFNHVQEIKIMKINNQNKCQHCGKIYNEAVTKNLSMNPFIEKISSKIQTHKEPNDKQETQSLILLYIPYIKSYFVSLYLNLRYEMCNLRSKFMIDLWKIPADQRFAQNHGKACLPGKAKDVNSTHKNQICPCCLNTINKEQISLFQNSKELQFLGFGIPLYFIFVKYCLVLLIILITSYNGYAMYKAIADNQQFCSSHHRRLSSTLDPSCSSFFILFSQIEYSVTIAQVIQRIFSFILQLFALVYIRDSLKKLLQQYDQRTTSLSDYSLLIKNLPGITGIQKCIKEFMQNNFKQQWSKLQEQYNGQAFKNDKKVIKIILLPNLDKYYQLEQEKKFLIYKKKHILDKQIIDKQEITGLDQQIGNVNFRIRTYCENQQNLAHQDKLKCQQAIVIFNMEIFKQTVVEYAENTKLDSKLLSPYFGELQNQIEIFQAPEPKEIIWKNINYPIKQHTARIALGWTLTVLFIAVITVVFYFLLKAKTKYLVKALQEQASHDEHSTTDMNSALALVYIIIILIILFNKLIMGWVLHYFAHIEKHFSTSQEEFSFAFKYTLGLFFTTALMTLAVQAISFHNFYAHAYGVIEQQGIMFFMNAFFVPLIWLINPWQLFVIVKRKLTKKYDSLTQGEANQLMEDVQYTVGKRYAEVIQIMWFTLLYATLIPFGAMLSLIGLSLYYWVDKYNLLRRSSLKTNVSGDMTMFSLKLLDFTLVLRPIGEMIFDSQIRDGVNPQSIVFIVIGFIYLILPMNSILDFFHDQKFRLQQKSFQQVKDKFLQTYSILHPIMKQTQGKLLRKIQKHTSNILDFSQDLLLRKETTFESQLQINTRKINSLNQLNNNFNSQTLISNVSNKIHPL